MTIKEIASLAGVSASTVSKIVNNKDSNINAETRSRVLRIVKEYNYTPYASAKSAADTKTFILGVLLRSTAHTGQFLNGVLEEARDQGYSVMVYDSGMDATAELKNITSLCKNRADGVIWEPVCAESLAHAHYLTEQGMACYVADGPDGSGFHIDYRHMGYGAAKKLLDYRHTRIGCLVKEGDRRSNQVFEGFRQCLFDHQIPYLDKMRLTIGGTDWDSRILSRAFTGIVSSHYHSALLLLEQLEKFKYRVPHDLSIISLRGDGPSNPAYPKLSTIRIPFRDFGSFLCSRLIGQCEKRPQGDGGFTTGCSLESLASLDSPSPGHQKKIVVVGSINIDITLNLESLPQPGNTMITDKCTVIPGGKGANQAVGAAKLGNEVSLIGKVGNDYDATIIYSSMEDHRVNLQGIDRDPYTETGKAYIHVQKDGESTITILTGANKTLCPEDIRKNRRLFEDAGYCLLQTEVPQEALREAARTAKDLGVKTILKPAAITSLPLGLLPYIDIFVPNKREADALCPEGTVEEKADRFLDLGVETVIITLGHNGCYMRAAGESHYFPAFHFKSADTTGAADAFISALAVYLLNGYPLEKAIPIASCAAGFCVSRQGVIPALIDRNSLEAYIRNTDPELLRL